MWQDHTPEQLVSLRALGITAGKVIGNRTEQGPFIDNQIVPFQRAGLRWYVENIATDFYASYHRYTAGKPVNWRFLEAQRLFRENPADPRALIREPSLSDAAWLARIQNRLRATAKAQSPHKPLFYNLGDETGIADLAAYWDFDFSQPSLEAMRVWLQLQYGTLLALNRQWGTSFTAWSQVRPETTAQAIARTDENFSAWADFKAWMDVAFARALRSGTDALHQGDPTAVAGIEGGQVPGWGGYDYSLLSNSVDLMEIYDFGRAVDIARSLNPSLLLLTTSFAGGPEEIHRVWRQVLKGGCGLLLWDENYEFIAGGTRPQEFSPYFHEMTSGLGRTMIGAQPQYDPVAILYSPASMRTAWMLEWKPNGDAWSRRDAEAEYKDNPPIRIATENFASGIERLGLTPRFVSPELVAQGALQKKGVKVLVLPHAISLSAAEADAIGRFVDAGGTIIADSEPGLFDQHSRRLKEPALAELFPHAPSGTPERFAFGPGKAAYLPSDSAEIDAVLTEAGVAPPIRVSDPTGKPMPDVRIYRYQKGDMQIVALHREYTASNMPIEAVIDLRRAAAVTDIRAKKSLGSVSRLTVTLDSLTPTILSLSDKAVRP